MCYLKELIETVMQLNMPNNNPSRWRHDIDVLHRNNIAIEYAIPNVWTKFLWYLGRKGDQNYEKSVTSHRRTNIGIIGEKFSILFKMYSTYLPNINNEARTAHTCKAERKKYIAINAVHGDGIRWNHFPYYSPNKVFDDVDTPVSCINATDVNHIETSGSDNYMMSPGVFRYHVKIHPPRNSWIM